MRLTDFGFSIVRRATRDMEDMAGWLLLAGGATTYSG